MAWSSRSSTTSAPGFVGVVMAAMGETKGRAYLGAARQAEYPPLTVSVRQVLDEVIAGEYSIGLEILNNHAAISAAQGAPVAWISLQPSMAVLNVLSMTKAAPHPNAAKLFFDFLVSSEGQQLYRDADYIPVDPDVPPRDPSLRPDGDELRRPSISRRRRSKTGLPTWTKIYNEVFR